MSSQQLIENLFILGKRTIKEDASLMLCYIFQVKRVALNFFAVGKLKPTDFIVKP